MQRIGPGEGYGVPRSQVSMQGSKQVLTSSKERVAGIGHAPDGNWSKEAGIQQSTGLQLGEMQAASQFQDERFAFGQKTAFFPPTDGIAMQTEGFGQLLLGEVLALAKLSE